MLKKILLVTILLIIGLSAQDNQSADKADIKECVMNYIEGWYSGDADRMEKALHPKLNKHGMMRDRNTSEIGLLPVATKDMMVNWTKKGPGKLPKDQWNIIYELHDKLSHIATVKVTSAKFIDYCQLIKDNGEWKIINVVWQSK